MGPGDGGRDRTGVQSPCRQLPRSHSPCFPATEGLPAACGRRAACLPGATAPPAAARPQASALCRDILQIWAVCSAGVGVSMTRGQEAGREITLHHGKPLPSQLSSRPAESLLAVVGGRPCSGNRWHREGEGTVAVMASGVPGGQTLTGVSPAWPSPLCASVSPPARHLGSLGTGESRMRGQCVCVSSREEQTRCV